MLQSEEVGKSSVHLRKQAPASLAVTRSVCFPTGAQITTEEEEFIQIQAGEGAVGQRGKW